MKSIKTQLKYLFILSTSALIACSSDDAPIDTSGNNPTPCTNSPILESVSQLTIGDLTTRLVVNTANKEGSGFIVVNDNALAELGVSSVNCENSNVTIDLNRPVVDSETITVTLHEDSNDNGTYDSGVDMAVQSIGGGNNNVSSSITVSSDLPNIRFITTANGSASWSISAEPITYTAWGSFTGSSTNPTFTFSNNINVTPVTSYRIEIENPTTVSHPFSMIYDDNAGTVNELVTQGGAGSYYGDTDVNVVESGNRMQLTITSTLINVGNYNGYRCDIHIDNMKGSITFP